MEILGEQDGVKGFGLRSDEQEQKKLTSSLTFYMEPPTNSITLKEFEEMATARLELHRVLDRVNTTSIMKYSDKWNSAVGEAIDKLKIEQFKDVTRFDHELGNSLSKEKVERLAESRQYDVTSHFLLRLAFCKSDELRKAFISAEIDFFRYKFSFIKNDPNRLFYFLEKNNISIIKVDEDEKKQFEQELKHSNFLVDKSSTQNMDYFKVPFGVVLDLVRHRRVFLKGGLAYVSYFELIAIISTEFRKRLSHQIAKMARSFQRIEDDERLSIMLTNFDKRYTGNTFEVKKENGNTITFSELPEKAKASFPPCMKELFDVVERDHHLKHFGRLQLGLFLKGIGLSMDEATKFWRFNFTKKAGMDGTRFDKQYLYNIRHMYGKEGKRADYTPYSCMKIINSAVGVGDYHGCIFKHCDTSGLISRLKAANINEEGTKEILELVSKKNYQIACQKYFECKHPGATIDGGVQHPNQYFEESEKGLYGRGRKKNAVSVTTERSFGNRLPPPPESNESEDGSSQMETETDWGNIEDDLTISQASESELIEQENVSEMEIAN